MRERETGRSFSEMPRVLILVCSWFSSWSVLGQDLCLQDMASALATSPKPVTGPQQRAPWKGVISGRTATPCKIHLLTAGLQAQMVSGVVSIRGSRMIPGGEGPNGPYDYPAHSLNISVYVQMGSGPVYPNNFPKNTHKILK